MVLRVPDPLARLKNPKGFCAEKTQMRAKTPPFISDSSEMVIPTVATDRMAKKSGPENENLARKSKSRSHMYGACQVFRDRKQTSTECLAQNLQGCNQPPPH